VLANDTKYDLGVIIHLFASLDQNENFNDFVEELLL
jgi:hypothetical protein